jgi:hypothetical protein
MGQAGEEVHPAMSNLFTIATDLSTVEVVLEPAPDQLRQIQPRQPALLTTADVASEPLEGEVASVENGKVTVRFANPSPLVKPGHTGEVRIRVK